jgi:hypothetical protein
MNLKEAKEYLQNNGFAVQRLNECGTASCGGGGCSGYTRVRTSCYSTGPCGTTYVHYERPAPAPKERLSTLQDIVNATKKKPVSKTPRPDADAMIQDLIEQIPDSKKEAVIQLLRILVLGGK